MVPHTVLKSRVTVSEDCVIGERCIVHPGVVIGADGFGFAKDGERWEKIEQLGAVRIGNDVEIGANTCIDRGALQDTVIEDGVKLDNLIQIGHNVRVGRNTAMAGCVGVAGSATIGANCTIGGSAGVLGHLTIADGVNVSSFSLVTRSLNKPGHYTGFYPAGRQCVLGKERRHAQAAVDLARARARAGKRTEGNEKMMMDIHEILKKLPHRYPFLLVDRVLEVEKGKRIKALKNVTINEQFFNGHFPHRPVMPGVLMLEALAQAAALLSFETLDSVPDDNTVYYFAGIDGARFKRPVEPGDQLILEVELLRMKAGIFKFKAQALVGDELAVEAELMCTMRKIA